MQLLGPRPQESSADVRKLWHIALPLSPTGYGKVNLNSLLHFGAPRTGGNDRRSSSVVKHESKTVESLLWTMNDSTFPVVPLPLSCTRTRSPLVTPAFPLLHFTINPGPFVASAASASRQVIVGCGGAGDGSFFFFVVVLVAGRVVGAGSGSGAGGAAGRGTEIG